MASAIVGEVQMLCISDNTKLAHASRAERQLDCIFVVFFLAIGSNK